MRDELALPPRIAYVALLLVSTAMAVVVAALLLTEPSLPTRTIFSFAVMLAIAVCWMAFAAWVLRWRRVLLAGHQVIAARMATVFTLLFTAGAIAFAPWRENRAGALAIVLAGTEMVAVAAVRLVRSTRRQRSLLARRATLAYELALC